MAQSANIKFAETYLALRQMGINIVNKAKKNLKEKRRHRAASGRTYTSKIDNSGKLSRSLKSSIIKRGTLEIQMDDYGQYVDKGRKPGKYAPVRAIQEWVKSKPINPRDAKGRFMKRTPAAMKSLAFLLNHSIYEHGITETNFFSNPLDEEMDKFEKKLDITLNKDFDEYLNKI